MANKKSIEFYIADSSSELSLPFVGGVKAGFPSPAQDYIESALTLIKSLQING